jgi:hypothetical protein
MKPRRSHRAFAYRAGIRLPGTDITCDALGFASDLVFISHADAFPARARTGRRQFVSTATTVRLLGPAGDRLREHVLPASFGRPFNLGAHRLEIVPSGFLPGAAALLCQIDRTRAFYLGSFCPEPLLGGVEAPLLRRADALCVDATHADPSRTFAPRRQVLCDVRDFVLATLHGHGRVALLGSPWAALPAVAIELARAGVVVRAHRRVAEVFGRLRSFCATLPAPARFAGKLAEGEALLWPAAARAETGLAKLGSIATAWVSGAAVPSREGPTGPIRQAFALSNRPSFTELAAAVTATGAREVGLFGNAAELAADRLRRQGVDAYPLGPPRQMPLTTRG